MSKFYCRMLLPSSSSLLISVTKNCVITLRADLSLRSFTCHWKDYFIRVMTTGKQMFHQVAKENLPCLCSTVLSKLFCFIGGTANGCKRQVVWSYYLPTLFLNLRKSTRVLTLFLVRLSLLAFELAALNATILQAHYVWHHLWCSCIWWNKSNQKKQTFKHSRTAKQQTN